MRTLVAEMTSQSMQSIKRILGNQVWTPQVSIIFRVLSLLTLWLTVGSNVSDRQFQDLAVTFSILATLVKPHRAIMW